MNVEELGKLVECFEFRRVAIWNAKGNSPRKGFDYASVEKAVEAYGDEKVTEWKIEGIGDKRITLTIKLAGLNV